MITLRLALFLFFSAAISTPGATHADTGLIQLAQVAPMSLQICAEESHWIQVTRISALDWQKNSPGARHMPRRLEFSSS